MIKLPVKITPDRIRDAIVQVFFTTSIPFEPLVGFCYQVFTGSGWRYADRRPTTEPATGLVIEFNASPQHFFIKDTVRIQLQPDGSLAFNCINKYIGWQAYSQYIQSALHSLTGTGYVTGFRRIGIRYISEFANIDILEKINFRVEAPFITSPVSNSNHRIAFEEDGMAKTVNIASKLPVNAMLTDADTQVNFVSLLDVDVSARSLTITTAEEAWSHIDRLHTAEKMLFFGLLTKDFLQTLNPEYA